MHIAYRRGRVSDVFAAYRLQGIPRGPLAFLSLSHLPLSVPPPLRDSLLAGTSLLISSNHFFLWGNRDVSRSPRRIPGAASRGDVRHAAGTCPLNLSCASPLRGPSVPFHGEPVNFMGSLMKSFQNSPPSAAAILSRLNWTNRISSRPNPRRGHSPFRFVLSTSRAIGARLTL